MNRDYEADIAALLDKVYESYEVKEMLNWAAMQAIEKLDISEIYRKNCVFKDDYPYESLTRYSSEEMRTMMRNYGIEDYVKKALYELENLELCD